MAANNTPTIGRPRKYKTPDDLWKVAEEYFKDQVAKGQTPNFPGVALFLGFCAWSSILDLERAQPQFSDVVKKIRSYIETCNVLNAVDSGKIGSMFYLKAALGYREDDRADMTNTIPTLIGEIGAILTEYVPKEHLKDAIEKLRQSADKVLTVKR